MEKFQKQNNVLYQYNINLLELIFVPGIFKINCAAEK